MFYRYVAQRICQNWNLLITTNGSKRPKTPRKLTICVGSELRVTIWRQLESIIIIIIIFIIIITIIIAIVITIIIIIIIKHLLPEPRVPHNSQISQDEHTNADLSQVGQQSTRCIGSECSMRYLASCNITTLIARFMGPTWGPSGAVRTQVGTMLFPWTLLSGERQEPPRPKVWKAVKPTFVAREWLMHGLKLIDLTHLYEIGLHKIAYDLRLLDFYQYIHIYIYIYIVTVKI